MLLMSKLRCFEAVSGEMASSRRSNCGSSDKLDTLNLAHTNTSQQHVGVCAVACRCSSSYVGYIAVVVHFEVLVIDVIYLLCFHLHHSFLSLLPLVAFYDILGLRGVDQFYKPGPTR